MSDENLPAVQEQGAKVPVAFSEKGVSLGSLEEAWRFATGIIQGRMAPKGVSHPGAVVALIQAGAELGLPPMQALSNLTFVNGRLGIMGDAARALIHQKGLCDATGIRTKIEGDGDEMFAYVTSHRVGEVDSVTTIFTAEDAKKAKLWGKPGPWSEYPKRMLMYRALGFHVRDQYPDVLLGATLTEELRDHPAVNEKGRPERDITPAPSTPDPLLGVTLTVEDAGEPEDQPGPHFPSGSLEEEEHFTLEPPPEGECQHPEGFAKAEGAEKAFCIICGEEQPK